jgi:hypothetical protein
MNRQKAALAALAQAAGARSQECWRYVRSLDDETIVAAALDRDSAACSQICEHLRVNRHWACGAAIMTAFDRHLIDHA